MRALPQTMTRHASVKSAGRKRAALLLNASSASLAMLLASSPAHAQLAALNAALGHTVGAASTAAQTGAITPTLTPTMTQIVARHTEYQQAIQNQAAIVASANAAARAAARAVAQTIPNGLGANGLVAAVTATTANAQDPTGLKVWQGAALPTQANGTNGTVNVTVNQTDSRALLSWTSFNVGRDTTLTFDQHGHSDWVVVNRVVGGINPVTGLLDPSLTPSASTILGQIKADGTVYVLNRSGVLFGATAQVDTHSLVVSSLELGQTIYKNPKSSDIGQPEFLTKSVSQLNDAYLQNGILPAAHSGLLGYISGETHLDVTVAQGAQIKSSGGFVIIAAPNVRMAGEINPTVDGVTGTALSPTPGGQVSLVAGTLVDAITATGANGSVDPNVRGLVLVSTGGGTVDVSGSVNAPQGYISLVTDPTGTVNLSGILASSTSVSRNGKVALIGGAVNLLSKSFTDASGNAVTQSATISITADGSGATIPQSTDSLAVFKNSQVDIGNFYVQNAAVGSGQIQSKDFSNTSDSNSSGLFNPTLFPSLISIGANSILSAAAADVNIGGTTKGATYTTKQLSGIGETGVSIGDNAIIDVSGLDSVQVAASRNQIVISPAKKNELRDTPEYRDVATNGAFSLNGATLYVDARDSGVRADGVAWVGSPLLEAGSLAASIGITAPELMTKGGNVTMATLQLADQPLAGAHIPSISIAKTAKVDFSGGWVSYDAGYLRESKLRTADGRTVALSAADPNDNFVAVVGGFAQNVPQQSSQLVYNSGIVSDLVFSAAYAEGHDAGSLTLSGPTMAVDGNLHGDATAGERQVAAAQKGTASSTVAGDARKLQTRFTQLPTAGLLHINAISGGGSILYGGTATTGADGATSLTVQGRSITPTTGLIHLSDTVVNAANLSALSLQSSGAVTFAEGSVLDLQPGGVLNVDAGRTISFNGTVSVPAGTIRAQTHEIQLGDIFDASDNAQTGNALPSNYILSGGVTADAPAWQRMMSAAGSQSVLSTMPGWFDIVVNPNAVLSARGLWTNDQLNTASGQQLRGSAYTSGGSVSLTVAPHVAVTTQNETHAVDISGSIHLRDTSLIDVSGGGYVSSSGALSLNGKGGNVSLIDETVYFQLVSSTTTIDPVTGLPVLLSKPTGNALFDADATGFQLGTVKTSTGGTDYFKSALTPDTITSQVDIASGASIRSFGFQGGGTFKLVTPDLAFNQADGSGTQIPLDFLDRTGFGTLDLTAWKTAIFDNVFDNGAAGKTALAATQMLTLKAGDVLNLTQTVLPSILTLDQSNVLRATASDTDISRLSVVAPTNALGDYDNKAANLVLGGLTELDILSGAKVIGAAGASITAPKLYNAGTIDIRGGSITQSEILPTAYVFRGAVGVGQQTGDTPVDPTAALSAIFGPAKANGLYDQTAMVIGAAAPVSGSISIQNFLTQFAADHQVYLLGRLSQDQGLLFTAGSTTNLSGGFIQNPRAPVRPDGTPVATGRLVDGGSITALARSLSGLNAFVSIDKTLGSVAPYVTTAGPISPAGQRPADRIDALAGAVIDISGASATIDMQTDSQTLTPTLVGTNAGTLTGLGGGDISAATIRAKAGIPSAQGGTLQWYNPVLQQNAGSVAATTPRANLIFADQIMAAGFDNLTAYGTLDTRGDVTLRLGRTFVLASPLGVVDSNTFSYYNSAINGTGNLLIQAPHIALSSIMQKFGGMPTGNGASTLTLRAEATSGTGASLDITGAVQFGGGFGSVLLSSQGDIRLTGVAPINNMLDPSATVLTPSLSGGVAAAGTLTFQAREVYATTGTGNLVQDPTVAKKDVNASTAPFIIASLASAGEDNHPTVTFRREPGTSAVTPYSAGSYILVAGENILQDGVLEAPLGRIDLGARQGYLLPGSLAAVPATTTLTLTSNSVTSVSADGLNIPYGTTIDLTDYFFTPTLSSALTQPPAAQLSLSAGTITTQSGATVDASGGGSTYAYEFVSGTGGSRDVLSRFNPDAFSGNNGYLYPDQRQVYAILPANSPLLAALYDPIYSSDYSALYGVNAGRAVTLGAVPATATSPGLAAGTYILLPAKYAMLPGAMRLVENVGSAAPVSGTSIRQRDGSVIVGGTYAIAGTNIANTVRTSFTLQSQNVFSAYSQIHTTDAATYFRGLSTSNGTALPRLPNDAARIVIDAGTGLTIGNRFDAAAATDPAGNVGRGSQVDILGDIINIVSGAANAGASGVNILASDLVNLNAESLMIGGLRTNNVDGTTSVAVSAGEIHVRNYATDSSIASQSITLTAPEILFAVNGANSVLDISDNAVITATGTLSDTRSGVYDLTTRDATDANLRIGTVGGFLRVANGVERLVDRTGNTTPDISRDKTVFEIGKATISGRSATFDTSRVLSMDAANLNLSSAALGSDTISFSTRKNVPGFYVSPALEAKLSTIGRLTLYSSSPIGFTPGIDESSTSAPHVFQDLVLDAPGIRLIRPTTGNRNQDALSVVINARNVEIGNRFSDLACGGTGTLACGSTGNSLTINASGTLTLKSGTVRAYGFDRQVNLSATGGTYYTGTGKLDLGTAALNLATPFIADLGTGVIPKQGVVQANYEIDSAASVAIQSIAGSTAIAQTSTLAPGARFAVHVLDNGANGASAPTLSLTDTIIRATAGTIDLQSQGTITLAGAAALQAPSYSQTFGPSSSTGTADPDQVTVSASAGSIGLISKTGDIRFTGTSTAPRIAIGGKTGGSGSLTLLAAQGTIDLGADVNAGSSTALANLISATSPNGGASLIFDSGRGSFNLDNFVTQLGSTFTGDIAIRTGAGDLSLGAGQKLRATSVILTSDGGATRIAGTIDTSGVNGGDISLYGRDSVALASTALLDAHSTGYAVTDTRQATGGDIILGVTADGAIDVAANATINLGVNADRAGNADGYRAVAKQQTDPVTHNQTTSYTIVQGDQGGTLTLRAPVVTASGGDSVNIRFAGTVTGTPSDVSVIGVKSFDLDGGIDKSRFSGVTIANGVATLDAGASVAGKANFLSDEAAGTIPDFIQHFDISAANTGLGTLTSLANFHEKPGVELAYGGTITLASNWNLGAGRIVDAQAALAAGDLSVSPLSILATAANGAPTTVYDVVANREADLFQNYVHMLYRTGTGVNTGGEAGVFTFRAGGDLNITHSISDGFFSFADQTDQTYLTYQLGGGTQLFTPTVDFQCGNAGCSNMAALPAANAKGVITLPLGANSLTFNLGTIDRTLIQVNAPYSAAANSAAAYSNGTIGGGDPLGGAQLFPLLSVSDANGRIVSKAAASSGIQLVAGAGAIASADPLHIDRGAGGSVTVSGSTSYDLSTSGKGTGLFTGNTLLQSANYQSLSTPLASLAEFKTLFANFLKGVGDFPTGVDDLGQITTRITVGANSPYSKAILDFIAAHPGKAAVLGTKANPTGLATTLDLAVQFFLQTNAIDAAGQAKVGQSISNIGGRVIDAGTVVVPTLVRTGTGRIDVAAAANVDLTNGDAQLRNDNLAKTGSIAHPLYQRGGTAIYTAGHLVQPTPTTINGLTVDPTAYLPKAMAFTTLWQPDLSGHLQANPVFASGGGDVTLAAGGDILGRRDVWNENVASSNGGTPATVVGLSRSFTSSAMYGAGDQRWRVGQLGADQSDILGSTYIRVNAQAFSSGVATLGGGNVSLHAGGDVREMTVALDTTLASADVGSSFGSMLFGGGNLDVRVGGDIAGGRFDIATGTADFHAGQNISSSGYLAQITDFGQASTAVRKIGQLASLPEIRITDTVVTMSAGGSVSLADVSALGLSSSDLNSLGNFTGTSTIRIMAGGSVDIAGGPSARGGTLADGGTAGAVAKILPASLDITSFDGNIDLGQLDTFLYPSAKGELSLLAGGTLADGLSINMDDGDPSLLPGLYSAYAVDRSNQVIFGRGFYLPSILPNTSDATRRLYHYGDFATARDATPVRIAANGNINNLTLYSPKQTRVSATGDIVNMIFVGQNLGTDDTTRIVAGRDITSTTSVSVTNITTVGNPAGRILSGGSFFALGGPGAFFMEAGRNLGPFLNSATIANFQVSSTNNVGLTNGQLSFPGGILAVGNDYNPWLAAKSADIYAFFGVGKGMDYTALRSTYLDPANISALPGDLFEQTVDTFGNKTPDRTRPVYAAILIAWMQQNQAPLLTSLYGTTNVTYQQAYDAFAGKAGVTPGLSTFVQERFLLDHVYFNELSAPAQVDGPSYLQYVRGYRAVETLFPSKLGYTQNDTTGAGNGAVKDANGNPVLQHSGNLDLRLAAIETTRDSNITLLGPGGNAILGSVTRTSALAASRAYQPFLLGSYLQDGRPTASDLAFPVASIPIGYEGILSLRGGSIHSFTDGDLRLNQSRLFTQDSGNIVLWSSNGDLNAGQGPKSSADVPPIVLRFDPNGGSEIDSAAGVTGAGIAGFAGIRRLERDGAALTDSAADPDLAAALAALDQLPLGSTARVNGKSYRFALTDPLNDNTVGQNSASFATLAKGAILTLDGKTYRRDLPTIYLLAPAGTVDAGDAGVRAAGDIVVAAAQVANADNFKVGGSAVGVPSLAAAPSVALPAGATAAIVANVFKPSSASNADQRSRITVDVLGVYSFDGGSQDDPATDDDSKKKN